MKDIIKMRLIAAFLVGFLCFLVLGNRTVKIPWVAPYLTCEVNGEKIKAFKNEHMWSFTGNSNLGIRIEKAAEKLEGHKINAGSSVKIKLSSDKGLKDFKVKQFVVDDNGVRSNIDVLLKDNTITIAEKPGEYIYSFIAGWNETHWVEYIIKFVVED